MRPVAWVVYAGNLVLLASNWLPCVSGHLAGTAWADRGSLPLRPSVPFGDWPSLALCLTVFAVFSAEMRRFKEPGGVTANIAAAVLALVYIGIFFSFIVQLRLVWGIGALASLIIVVKMADSGAYAVGRLFGRHKMTPMLSPGKTWEGLCGGLLFALLGSCAVFAWLIPALFMSAWCRECPRWGWIVFGLAVGSAAAVGDLAESLLKRDAVRKNSSTWMPGFGGVLDVLDSILMAAPVAYVCWEFHLIGGF